MKRNYRLMLMFLILLCSCTTGNTLKDITNISLSKVKCIASGSPLMSHVKETTDKEEIKRIYNYVNIEYELVDINFSDLVIIDDNIYSDVYFCYELLDRKGEELITIIEMEDYLYFTTEEVFPKSYCSVEKSSESKNLCLF